MLRFILWYRDVFVYSGNEGVRDGQGCDLRRDNEFRVILGVVMKK